MKTKFNTRSMVLLGLLTAIVVVFSLTPIGSIPIGPLVITLNIIPIAIAAVALGPIVDSSWEPFSDYSASCNVSALASSVQWVRLLSK